MAQSPRANRFERNLIINGNMRYAQRRLQIQNATPGAGSISYGTAEYTTVDRYRMAWNATVDGSYSQGRFEDAPSADPTLRYCMDFRGNAVSGNRWAFQQAIEDIYARRAAGKTVTISFWYKLTNGTININPASSYILVGRMNSRNSLAATTEILRLPIDGNLVRDGSWRRFSVNVDIPLAGGLGLFIEIRNEFASAATITDRITGFSMLIGEDVVPDEFVFASDDEVQELELCERYFEKSYNTDTDLASISFPGVITNVRANGTNGLSVPFRTIKRATPAISVYSPNTGALNNIRDVNAGVDRAASIGDIGTRGIGSVGSVASAVSSAQVFHYIADAEIN
jgi:hypothetical protein